jgi:hypothetical protein
MSVPRMAKRYSLEWSLRKRERDREREREREKLY